MKKLALLFSIIVLASGICLGQTSAFTYQGKLGSSGAPASGVYQFEFKLFNADLAGTQIGTTQTVVATVTGGAFSTRLDFGAAAFPGDADRWLDIGVRLNGAVEPYTVLSPRQQINSVPFAVRSLNATNADIATNATNATTANTATTAGNVTGVVPVTNGGTGSATQNFVDLSTNQRRIAGDKEFLGIVSVAGTNGVFNGNGSGLTNLNGANLTDGSITAAKLAPGAVFRWGVVTAPELQAEGNNAYVINRPTSEVSVNLPSFPQVGDFIRVESATEQGFRITQNSGQSITIGNGNLQNLSWTSRETERFWKSVASSADGAKLVAVPSHFDTIELPGLIYTSTDSGVTWFPRENLRMWSSVASSADGTKLVAAVIGGRIYTSTDSGITWTPRESNRSWTSVVSSPDGVRLIALTPQVYVSTDSGESWFPQTAQAAQCYSVASSANGGLLVGDCLLDPGTNNARQGIVTSDNGGASWTLRKTLLSNSSVASSADGAKLVAAVIGGQIYTSTDSGVTWTPREGNRQWVSVASSANGIKLVAAVKSGNIYTSADSGITWTPQQVRDWASVASSADGTKLVAAADRDFIWTRDASVSTSGGTGGIIAGNSTSVELIYLGAGKFLILNQKGSIVFY